MRDRLTRAPMSPPDGLKDLPVGRSLEPVVERDGMRAPVRPEGSGPETVKEHDLIAIDRESRPIGGIFQGAPDRGTPFPGVRVDIREFREVPARRSDREGLGGSGTVVGVSEVLTLTETMPGQITLLVGEGRDRPAHGVNRGDGNTLTGRHFELGHSLPQSRDSGGVAKFVERSCHQKPAFGGDNVEGCDEMIARAIAAKLLQSIDGRALAGGEEPGNEIGMAPVPARSERNQSTVNGVRAATGPGRRPLDGRNEDPLHGGIGDQFLKPPSRGGRSGHP